MSQKVIDVLRRAKAELPAHVLVWGRAEGRATTFVCGWLIGAGVTYLDFSSAEEWNSVLAKLVEQDYSMLG